MIIGVESTKASIWLHSLDVNSSQVESVTGDILQKWNGILNICIADNVVHVSCNTREKKPGNSVTYDWSVIMMSRTDVIAPVFFFTTVRACSTCSTIAMISAMESLWGEVVMYVWYIVILYKVLLLRHAYQIWCLCPRVLICLLKEQRYGLLRVRVR